MLNTVNGAKRNVIQLANNPSPVFCSESQPACKLVVDAHVGCPLLSAPSNHADYYYFYLFRLTEII